MQAPSSTSNGIPPIVAEKLLAIVGGGPVDAGLLHMLSARGAVLVGADAGGDAIAAADLTPDAIIGDMDSLSDLEGWSERTRVIRIEEQITTDLEKCLYSTAAPVTVIAGATGRRFDHTLAALDAVSKYARTRHIVLTDETDLVLGVTGPFDFTVEPGSRISLHPLQPTRFASSEGLRYSLKGLTLAPGGRGGTSNLAETGRFSITPADGETALWLLIMDLRHLPGLLDRLAEE